VARSPCTPVDQHVSKDTWLVTHDPIDAVVEKRFHLRGLVDCPHMYLNIEIMGKVDHGLGSDRNSVMRRYLSACTSKQRRVSNTAARKDQTHDFGLTHRRTQFWTELASTQLDAAVVERANAYPIDCSMGA